MFRLLLTSVLFSLLSFLSVVHSADDSIEKLSRHYQAAKKQAKAQGLHHFDNMIAQIRRSRLPATTKVSLITQLDNEREQFNASGVWPRNDDLAGAALEYARQINAKYLELHRAYEKKIDALVTTGRDKEAKELTQEKIALEKDISGRDLFTTNSKWHGTRFGSSGKNASMRFDLERMTGNQFDGQIHLNPGVAGHPIIQVRGTINGSYLEIITVKMIQGDNRLLHFSGYLYGDKILMAVGGKSVKGTSVNDRAWLTNK